MESALLSPDYELFPNRYRWTVAECNAMAAEGRLVGRYELLDGEVIRKMGQTPPHFFGISQLAHWANAVFGDRFVRSQGPIALHEPDGVYSVPEPDIAVTRQPSSAYALRQPLPEDLLLVMEVSDTTLRTDLIVKSRLYARAGIPEYCVLDLNARKLHVYRSPDGEVYTSVAEFAETAMVNAATRPEFPILVAELLASSS